MYAPIFAVCFADAAVGAALGTAPMRLYSFGQAPQGSTAAYATWQSIGGSPENYLGDRPDIDQFALQVDCWAATVSEVRAVAMALRDAIEPHAHITRWGGESHDAATGLFRYSFDVLWHVSR